MASDGAIMDHINELIDEEKKLRAQLQRDQISEDTEHERLRVVEEQLDRLWDLLRQRRAKSEFGEDPNDARERSAGEVEGYIG